MGSPERFRLSKRKAGKTRKLRSSIAEHYEEAFRVLIGGVKPPPVTTVTAPPGVLLGSNVRRRTRASPAERERDAQLRLHMKELLSSAADYFRAQNTVKMCVRCRSHQESVTAETARLHHVLEKILGDLAPPRRRGLL